MPADNPSNPNPIPDMSLGDRADNRVPGSPIPPWEVNSSIEKPTASPSKPAGVLSESAGSPKLLPEWRVGDRVLAPWEPTFLYPGIITEIERDESKGDRAHIQYDDGGTGWVYLFSLCPFDMKPEQEIEVRRSNDATFTPGEIADFNGARVLVDFGDEYGVGHRNTEWVDVDRVRVPCVANGPGAMSSRTMTPLQAPADPASTGSGIPGWAIAIGIVVISWIVRAGCRELSR